MHQITIRRLLPGLDVELKSADAYTGDTPRLLCRHYVLSALLAGRGSRRYRGASYYAGPASCALMQPEEVYSGSAQGMSYRSLWVAPLALEVLAADVTGRAGPPRFPEAVLPDADLAARLRHLSRLAGQQHVSPLEVEGTLLEVLANLLIRHAERRAPVPAVGKERCTIRQVREYLEDNFTDNVTLGQLADVAGLSPYRVSHVFRAAVGVPPHDYLTQTRVARARSLLAQGLSVGDTAQRVGFFDQAHLTRHFRRLVQVTPGSYRRLCRRGPARSYNLTLPPGRYNGGAETDGGDI